MPAYSGAMINVMGNRDAIIPKLHLCEAMTGTNTNSSTFVIHTGFFWRAAKWMGFLNVIVLFASGIVYDLLADPGRLPGKLSTSSGIQILAQFNLTAENTLATGYSSMLLFFTAAVAAICFLKTARNGERGWGWLVMLGFFTLLSLDELGSLHENAGKLASMDVMGTSTWESVLSLPLLIAITGVMAGVVSEVRWSTVPFWLMAAGAFLFLSVPVHEYIETLMWRSNDSEWTRPVLPGLLEEGTELFAALLFLVGMVLWMAPHGKSLSRSAFSVTFTKKAIRLTLVSGTIVVLIGLSIMHLLAGTLNADEGIAVNWFPAAMAMLVLITTRCLKPGRQLVVTLYCIALAGYFASDFYSIIHWKAIATLSWLIRIIMAAGLVWFIFEVSLPFVNFAWRIGCIAAGMMISTAFVFEHPAVTFAATAGLITVLIFQIISSPNELPARAPVA